MEEVIQLNNSLKVYGSPKIFLCVPLSKVEEGGRDGTLGFCPRASHGVSCLPCVARSFLMYQRQHCGWQLTIY